MDKFDHKNIESKWQKIWNEENVYHVGEDKLKPKYYVLDMFPYPSGAGLHVGHPKGYIATDILARMKMMSGFNVLHPMGWDAFGLPAENYALKNKTHPAIQTAKNVETYKIQLEKIGMSYDWDREINTTDPEYYKWTQWAFIKMWEKGLAYESSEPIIWCPSCQTGLAMEDLEDGKCERCGSEIERKPMRQWVIKITDYADRLLNDIDKLSGWEDSIKEMQRNWIGRSEGAEIEFVIARSEATKQSRGASNEDGIASQEARNDKVVVFTTRPDTLFGCTYVVLAPENKLIENWKLEIGNWDEVENYIKKTKAKSDLERTDLNKDKTGVKLEGIMAINPANGEEVPVFIADYVLANYGTGAVMAVPAHDERDFEFAKKYDLKIKSVVIPNLGRVNNNEKTDRMLDAIEKVKSSFVEKNIKLWFNGTFGVAAYYGDFFKEPKDIDCGVLEKYFNVGKKIIEDLDFKKVEDKENEKFKVSTYKKDDIVLEIGTFDKDLGDKVINFKGHEILVPEAQWLADCYKITSQKERRRGENDLDRSIFLEAINNSLSTAFVNEGINVNSDFLNGLPTTEAKKKMIEWLEKEGKGKKKVNYKLNDWVFSRQRYWGEPIPMVHCDKCGTVPVAEKDLPVVLPEVEHYEPTGTGESPLANIYEWVNTTCPVCGGAAKRETNTMPQWAGSSWYYLRYIDSKNSQALVDKEKEKYWSPVDFYVGGAEHATRHLIYARFWHKFLFDIGTVNYEEPFTRLQHVGLIMAEDGRKMSKRWGNVINPDDIIEQYGADAMRVYEMFMGPFGQSCAWNTNGLVGARKFLDKIYDYFEVYSRKKDELEKLLNSDSIRKEAGFKAKECLLHKTIKKVGEDIAEFKFNTAISQMMILMNELKKEGLGDNKREESFAFLDKESLFMFIQILAPFAPHLAEEIWREKLGNKESIFKFAWPQYDKELIKDETVNLVIQVNGKLRATISVPADISEEDARKLALENENVKKYLAEKETVKIIFIPGKLLNIVLK